MSARFNSDQASKLQIVEVDRRWKKPRISKAEALEKADLELLKEKAKKAEAPKKSKYNSRKTVVGSITFDSAKEAKRWGELKLLEKTGEITGLERQVNISMEVNGVKVCGIRPDFRYYDNQSGRVVVEDVKGYRDARHGAYAIFRIKAKLYRALYGYDITEI